MKSEEKRGVDDAPGQLLIAQQGLEMTSGKKKTPRGGGSLSVEKWGRGEEEGNGAKALDGSNT